MLGRSPIAVKGAALLTLGSQLVVVGGQSGKKQRIHVAETRAGTTMHAKERHHN